MTNAEYCKKWQKANPDYSNKWRRANRAKTVAACRKWREAHPGENAIHVKKWRLANPEKSASALKNWRKANPEKKHAQALFSGAVRRGKMKKMPCFICGNPKAEGHHEDYSKPFEVIWLCKIHHGQQHRETIQNEQKQLNEETKQ